MKISGSSCAESWQMAAKALWQDWWIQCRITQLDFPFQQQHPLLRILSCLCGSLLSWRLLGDATVENLSIKELLGLLGGCWAT